MAQGSNYEVQTQLCIAQELGLGTKDCIQQAQKLNVEVGRMLTAFIAKVSVKKLEARS
jgi:four helix bundle protein